MRVALLELHDLHNVGKCVLHMLIGMRLFTLHQMLLGMCNTLQEMLDKSEGLLMLSSSLLLFVLMIMVMVVLTILLLFLFMLMIMVMVMIMLTMLLPFRVCDHRFDLHYRLGDAL